jgi:hypothetical protein
VTDVISQRGPEPPRSEHDVHPARRATDRSAVNNAEALDVVASTTTSRMWIALVAMAIVVAGGLVWAFVGTVSQQVQASGVLSPAGDTYTVVAGDAGSVSLAVQPGMTVAAGTKVASVAPFVTPDSAPLQPVIVKTPVAGRIQDVLVQNGAGVQPTDPLVVVVPTPDPTPDTDVVTYLSANDAAQFRVGAQVEVTLVNPATREPTDMAAIVSAVAVAPSTPEAVVATLGSQKLANAVLDRGNGTGYRVDVTLQGVDQLPPNERPIGGQIVTISNTYARPHPINLLFGS